MGKLLFMFIILLSASTVVQAQQHSIETTREANREIPNEIPPKFPGGDVGLMKFLSQVPYPPNVKAQGTVFITFTITEEGLVTDVALTKSSMNDALDNAALAHVKSMPQWQPAEQDGRLVKIKYTLPVKFFRP